MRPHVPCEITLYSCPVCTFVACVWFDARVRPHVLCEMTLPIRLVQAHGAKMHRLPLLLLFRLLLRGRPLPLFLPPAAARPTARRTSARTALSLPHWSTIDDPDLDWELRGIYKIKISEKIEGGIVTSKNEDCHIQKKTSNLV